MDKPEILEHTRHSIKTKTEILEHTRHSIKTNQRYWSIQDTALRQTRDTGAYKTQH
jgi:hypothetical protein